LEAKWEIPIRYENKSLHQNRCLFQFKCAALAYASAISAQTITFDDLNAGTLPGSLNDWSAPIPNGYAGLNWNNFGVMDVPLNLLAFPGDGGYENGLVSGNNAAWNEYGNPASISGGPFNLDSAYLTAAWNNGLQVEVEGFVGGSLTYNNTYTVNPTGPTLIGFNYLDVDEVTIISSGGVNDDVYSGSGTEFVMDNVTISAVPEPTTLAWTGLGGLASLVAFRRGK